MKSGLRATRHLVRLGIVCILAVLFAHSAMAQSTGEKQKEAHAEVTQPTPEIQTKFIDKYKALSANLKDFDAASKFADEFAKKLEDTKDKSLGERLAIYKQVSSAEEPYKQLIKVKNDADRIQERLKPLSSLWTTSFQKFAAKDFEEIKNPKEGLLEALRGYNRLITLAASMKSKAADFNKSLVTAHDSLVETLNADIKGFAPLSSLPANAADEMLCNALVKSLSPLAVAIKDATTGKETLDKLEAAYNKLELAELKDKPKLSYVMLQGPIQRVLALLRGRLSTAVTDITKESETAQEKLDQLIMDPFNQRASATAQFRMANPIVENARKILKGAGEVRDALGNTKIPDNLTPPEFQLLQIADQVKSLAFATERLDVVTLMLNEPNPVNIEQWNGEYINLYYFDDIPRLMKVLVGEDANTGAREVGRDSTARTTAAASRLYMLDTIVDLAKKKYNLYIAITNAQTAPEDNNDKLQELQKAVDKANEEVLTAMKNVYAQALMENAAFANARDNQPYWASRPPSELNKGDNTDPVRRVFLFGFPDSKTIFIRGRASDVQQVREIIASFDRPQAQALMTLWSLEISSDATRVGAEKVSNQLQNIEDELRICRAQTDASLSLMRQTINEVVDDESPKDNGSGEERECSEPCACKDRECRERDCKESCSICNCNKQDCKKQNCVKHDCEEHDCRKHDSEQQELKNQDCKKACLCDSAKKCGCELAKANKTQNPGIKAAVAFYDKSVFSDLMLLKKDSQGNDTDQLIDEDYIIKAVLPDPRDTTTLAEALVVLSLAKPCHRWAVIRNFADNLPEVLRKETRKALPQAIPECSKHLKEPQRGCPVCDKVEAEVAKRLPRYLPGFAALERYLGRYGDGAWLRSFRQEVITQLLASGGREIRLAVGRVMERLAQLTEQINKAEQSAIKAAQEGNKVESELRKNQRRSILAEREKCLNEAKPLLIWAQARPTIDELQSIFDAGSGNFQEAFLNSVKVSEAGEALNKAKKGLETAEKEINASKNLIAEKLTPRLKDPKFVNQIENMGLLKELMDPKRIEKNLFSEMHRAEYFAGLAALPAIKNALRGLGIQEILSLAPSLVKSRITAQQAVETAKNTSEASRKSLELDQKSLLAKTRNFRSSAQIAYDNAREAAANETIKRALRAVDEDLTQMFIEPMLNRVRKTIFDERGVSLGVFQRTQVIASNRLVAKVDPLASSTLDLAGEETDALKEALQLTQLIGQIQTGGTLSTLTGLQKIVPPEKETPPAYYGITSGNTFRITPVLDPTGQALRFRFDHVLRTAVREPSGMVAPQLNRIEQTGVNTEVQLSNNEISLISRFQTNQRLGRPTVKSGGLPVLKHIPILNEIPLVGWFSRRSYRAATVQQSLLLGQTAIYPTIGDVIHLLTKPMPDFPPPAPIPAPTLGWIITSTDLADNIRIPDKFANVVINGKFNQSPHLSWTAPPAGTKELALICYDSDAPEFVHWLIYGLNKDVLELPTDVSSNPNGLQGALQGFNGGGQVGYTGPNHPEGETHHYHFRLYALDTAVGLGPLATRKQLEAAMEGHIIGWTELVREYSQEPSMNKKSEKKTLGPTSGKRKQSRGASGTNKQRKRAPKSP